MGQVVSFFCRRKSRLTNLIPEQCPIENVETSIKDKTLETKNENIKSTKSTPPQETVKHHATQTSSRKLYRYKRPYIDSATLNCSEPSSDSSSNDSQDFESEISELTEQGFLNNDAAQNIYFDITTLKAKLNTEHITLRDISEHVVEVYKEYCKKEKSLVCPLSVVLEGLDLPSDATHLVVSFVTFQGDKFYIPYCLNHPEDPFPFEDPEWIMSGCHDEELPESILLIHEINNEMITKNLTDHLLYFSRDVFSAGFYKFRPYAWTWLLELSEDPNAILLTIRHCGDTVKYTSITVYNPTITEWYVKDEENIENTESVENGEDL